MSDPFSSLQGRAYELGGLAGAVRALRTPDFKMSATAQVQHKNLLTLLRQYNLARINSRFYAEIDTSLYPPDLLNTKLPALRARLFQGYIQGFCETRQFIASLKKRDKPEILWLYANPSMGEEEAHKDIHSFQTALASIADISTINFQALDAKGQASHADFALIVRTGGRGGGGRYHLIVYELSTRNSITLDASLNLGDPIDIINSLKISLFQYQQNIRSRDFKIAGDALELEVSSELSDYFRGLRYDKLAKKLFQGCSYLYSLYQTLIQLKLHDKAFKQWQPGENRIEFHVIAFTDQARHFLHTNEAEIDLLKEMGTVYLPPPSRKSYDEEMLKTYEAVIHKIQRNFPTSLKEYLRNLNQRVEQTFLLHDKLSDYLAFHFCETLNDYTPTAIPPTKQQLQHWLPALPESLRDSTFTSMQDAHAALVRHVWENHPNDVYVLSGTPGIGKTTALRNILAESTQDYLLIYLSPRLQVNADLIAKFDPRNDSLQGREHLICLNTNSLLIKNALTYEKKPALACRCLGTIPRDNKLLFLESKQAEELEKYTTEKQNQSSYRRIEPSVARDVNRKPSHGVFKTMVRAIQRLVENTAYRRIVGCIATQSNRQLSENDTTIGVHLWKLFGDKFSEKQKPDLNTIERFAAKIPEIVLFVDEVTGDGAGKQTVHEMLNFRREIEARFHEIEKNCPLRIRIVIADASLVNAVSVSSYLNEKRSQPDQVLLTGKADSKSLSLEQTNIDGLSAQVINANVFPANSLQLKWRPVISFSSPPMQGQRVDTVRKAYRDLQEALCEQLAIELVAQWQAKPNHQTIVIIQDKELIAHLAEVVKTYAKKHCPLEQQPEVLCLHAKSPQDVKNRIVTPVTNAEQQIKSRVAGIHTHGDLADIVIMTSSGTRGISFPNASKIICYIPIFSLESNFMEFLQGIYRGRGSGKGNELEREIELIVPQVLVDTQNNTTVERKKQQVNLLATLMLLRMSILTRIFGAAKLFNKSIACIPTAGTLVEGSAKTIMDEVHEAQEELKRNLRYTPQDTTLNFIVNELPLVFDNERTILYHNTGKAQTLASDDYRQRLKKQFLHDANQGLDVIAQGDYLPENCYVIGELILQRLDNFSEATIKEKNKHVIETHIDEVYNRISSLRYNLNKFRKNKDIDKQARDAATTLYSIMQVLAEEVEIDTESETRGSTLNRWLIYPLSSLSVENFWLDTVNHDFKKDTQKVLKEYFHAYVCNPNYTLPILSTYGKRALPWLLVRGPEIEQRLSAQFQTRYLISSTALALLNILLLAEQEKN